MREKITVEVTVVKNVWWDTEVKADLDGEVKQFIYLHTLCQFASGKPHKPLDVEKIEWIPKEELWDYDIVPPAVKAFEILGYE